jgi:uncharacterized protein YciI
MMKHFVVEANYCAPIERVRAAYPRHRAWLQKGYDLGLFLVSGPKDPPVGGYLVARAESAAALEAMFREEPLNVEKLATFTFTEFQPVKRQNWTEEWFA